MKHLAAIPVFLFIAGLAARPAPAQYGRSYSRVEYHGHAQRAVAREHSEDDFTDGYGRDAGTEVLRLRDLPAGEITIEVGRVKFRVTVPAKDAKEGDSPQAVAAGTLARDACAKCHSGEKAKKGFRLFEADGTRSPLTDKQRTKVALEVMEGHMPPGSDLNDGQKAALIADVLSAPAPPEVPVLK